MGLENKEMYTTKAVPVTTLAGYLAPAKAVRARVTTYGLQLKRKMKTMAMDILASLISEAKRRKEQIDFKIQLILFKMTRSGCSYMERPSVPVVQI